MDFIIGLPFTKIKTKEVVNTILVIIDRYIKFIGYFAIKIIIIIIELADLFFKRWLLFNILRGIMSNRGTIFNNTF